MSRAREEAPRVDGVSFLPIRGARAFSLAGRLARALENIRSHGALAARFNFSPTPTSRTISERILTSNRDSHWTGFLVSNCTYAVKAGGFQPARPRRNRRGRFALPGNPERHVRAPSGNVSHPVLATCLRHATAIGGRRRATGPLAAFRCEKIARRRLFEAP